MLEPHKVTDKNIGVFKIKVRELMFDFEGLLAIFNQLNVVIVRAESHFYDDSIHYVGISPFFRRLSLNEVMPLYEIEIDKNGEGKIFVSKVKEHVPGNAYRTLSRRTHYDLKKGE